MSRPSLRTLTRRTLAPILERSRSERPEGTHARILVATSGGGDSMALLHVLSTLRAELAFELVAVGIDHGLRDGAAAELELARGLAERLDVPFETVRVEVRPGSNVQARARDARHAALEEARVRSRAHFVATAHHADDRAETLLIRLVAGATPRGLAVLPPRDGPRLRPMIRAEKCDIVAHLARNDLPYATDPSNADPRFLRTRIRNELMPLLASLNPNIAMHLADLADELHASVPPDVGVPGVPGSLPKRVRQELRALAEKGPSASVALPGGLVARLDQTHTEYVVEKRHLKTRASTISLK